MSTSGLKQNHRGELYMEHRTPDGEIKTIMLTSLFGLGLGIIKTLKLDTNGNGHLHIWDEENEQFHPTKCPVFGCAVCDIANLPARMERFKQEHETV